MNILFIGDLHCGSYSGLWPTDWIPKRSKFSGVKYLNDCFAHSLKQLPEIDVLFLTGDLIDGPQKKSDNTYVFTSDLSEQAEGAIEILRPVKAKQIYRIDGTPYHEGFHNALKSLDDALGAKSVGLSKDFHIDGKILNIAHHPSGMGSSKGSQGFREMQLSRHASAEGLINFPTFIIASHCHYYYMQDDGTQITIQTPPWQLMTPYAIKAQKFKFRSKIGSVLMQKDETHWSGFRVCPILYDTPKDSPIKI